MLDLNAPSPKKVQAMCDLTGGNCFQAAANALLVAEPGTVLVHGEVSHGKIRGLRYSHAWLEYDKEFPDGNPVRMVREVANGKDVEIPAAAYYLMGSIIDRPGKLQRYTLYEATSQMIDTGHFGPWDLDCKL